MGKGLARSVENAGSSWIGKVFQADLVLLAMGFLGPEQTVLEQFCVQRDSRSNIATPQGKYRTSIQKIYAAGGKFLSYYDGVFISTRLVLLFITSNF